MADEEFSAILTCPACSTRADTDETGWVEFECDNCQTEFKVNVDPAKLAEHSLF